MTVLTVAVFAFAAGFLSCVALVLVVVWWAFADKRVRNIIPHEKRGYSETEEFRRHQ